MQNILVLGLGKSGIAAATFLSKEGPVSCWDAKEKKAFDEAVIKDLEAKGITLYFGEFPKSIKWNLLVLSPGVPTDLPEVLECKKKGAKLTGELELAYKYAKGQFIAITGTNGKTTTTTLVGEMFKEEGLDTKVTGNIGDPALNYARESTEETRFVTEVSSFQLETITDFRPRVSAILNITPDHLNRHHTMEEYVRVKHLVFLNQTKDDYFVYNADQETLTASLKPFKAPVNRVPFSFKKTPQELDKLIRKISFGVYEQDGYLYIRKEHKSMLICTKDDINIPGNHNLQNVLAACAIAYAGGISLEAIRRAIFKFQGVEHRIEFVKEIDGVRYINDSKGTNPDSTIRAVLAFDNPIILIAGGYDKQSDFSQLCSFFPGRLSYLLLMGVTADKIKKAAIENGFDESKIITLKNLDECVEKAKSIAQEGDVVLLSPACASWDMYNSYEERGEHFKKLVGALESEQKG